MKHLIFQFLYVKPSHQGFFPDRRCYTKLVFTAAPKLPVSGTALVSHVERIKENSATYWHIFLSKTADVQDYSFFLERSYVVLIKFDSHYVSDVTNDSV